MPADLRKYGGAPGRIRTCDTRFRRAVLYPLSYEGGTWWNARWRVRWNPPTVVNVREEG